MTPNEQGLDPEQVRTGLAEIVHAITDTPADQVTLEKSLEHDLGVDSLAMIEVVVGAEERFGVRVPEDAVREVRTVADAVDLITGLR